MKPSDKIFFVVALVIYAFVIRSLNDANLVSHSQVEGLLRASEGVHTAEITSLEAAIRFNKWCVALINSAIMFLMMYVFLWPFAANALDSGRQGIRSKIRTADERMEAALESLKESEEKMARIDADSAAVRDRERCLAEEDASNLVDFAEKEAKQIVDHAETSILREAKVSREALIGKIAGLAVDQAVEKIEGQDQTALRERLLNHVLEGIA